MSLYRYFKPVGKNLPDPEGPLSNVLPSSTIKAANDAVLATSRQPERAPKGSKRGSYATLTGVQQAQVARYAFSYGNKAAIHRYSEEYSTNIKDSSVSTWKSKYAKEFDRKRGAGEVEQNGDIVVHSIPQKKRGRPLLLGDELDERVKRYIKDVRAAGTPVDTTVVMASGEAIVRRTDKKLLKENGGPIDITKSWAKSLLTRIGYVKRKACSTAKVEPVRYEELKEQYLLDIKVVVEMEDITADLILNWDHTGINIVPGCPWTMEEKGTKRVDCVGLDNKWQITAVICATLSGIFLPFQVIYQGKTAASLPRYSFPEDWNVTYTPNHWSNEEKTLEYITSVILPYVKGKRSELKLEDDQPALVIYDEFKGQLTDAVHSLLHSNHIYVVKVPPNCTGRLQPMDLSVNKSAKDFLRRQFQLWYSQQVEKNMREKVVQVVDTKMSIMKPLGAKWLKMLYDYLCENTSLAINGFKAAGISEVLEISL